MKQPYIKKPVLTDIIYSKQLNITRLRFIWTQQNQLLYLTWLLLAYCDVRGQYFLLSYGSIALACNVTLTHMEKYGKKHNIGSWTHCFPSLAGRRYLSSHFDLCWIYINIMVVDPVNKSNYVSLHCIFPQLFVWYNKINNDLVAGDSAFLSTWGNTVDRGASRYWRTTFVFIWCFILTQGNQVALF